MAVPEKERVKREVNWPKLAFLGVILLAFAFYTEQAMGMEWRTQAGRIGPGFFPRILGGVAMSVTVLALVTEILAKPKEKKVDAVEAAEEAAEPDLGRHPIALAAFVIAAAVFAGLFGILGAALAGILFLGATLWFLDPEHRIRSVIIAVGVPVLLYIAFQTGLNVGLPQGILPIG
ncbi:tripartite tricarboxylate transporter TctB family protein [Mycolicibacterium sp. S2-37]|uniref:tripartite tricarboxylate transporter TctB family protein n=1 Tax=Mycolicibacterium sp. S2-37 TaxID=2810297 RepID=UPI001A93FD40|nr:tripartite tricarboxylate transporter TctB family protein [Mycolicibacterium sp. S2-37]MBO0680683.1 tripartite tricarboxylate transporter TctB family protein [Mycolicibacterium sp. S2-37]